MKKILTLLFFCLNVAGVSSASAQIYFDISDTVPNYRAYKHADECAVAISRMLNEFERIHNSVRDTAQFVAPDPAATLPAPVVSNGSVCMEKVDADTLPLEYIDFWAALLLQVNRDADVEKMYMRLFDTLPFEERVNRFSATLNTFRGARPARVEMVDLLYNIAMKDLPPDSVGWSAGLRVLMADTYKGLGNDSLARQLIQEARLLAETLPEGSSQREMSATLLNRAVRWSTESEGLDSLRISTDAYKRYLEHHWQRLSTRPLGGIIAEKAPEIKGDYWYEWKGKAGNYTDDLSPHPINGEERKFPAPGKVNLIAFLYGGCHRESGNLAVRYGREMPTGVNCRGALASVRRIQEAYPEVQVVIVSRTYGSLGKSAPMAPAKEAAVLGEYFLKFNRINGVLSVSETPYFLLSEHDRRRIDQPTENELNYSIEGHALAQHGTFLLTDEEGKLFYSGAINNPYDTELVLFRMIKAVLERKGSAD